MKAGYSGTVLAKKLGLKEGYKVLLFKQPDHYFDLFSDLPPINIVQPEEMEIDFIHLFFTSFLDLETHIGKFIASLKKTVCYGLAGPKGSLKSKLT